LEEKKIEDIEDSVDPNCSTLAVMLGKSTTQPCLHMHDADIKPRMQVRIIPCYGLPNASINICDLIGTACLAQAITVRLGTSCKESHYPLVSVVL